MRDSEYVDDIKHMMRSFKQDVPNSPGFPDIDTRNLRLDLIAEEFEELKQASFHKDLAGYFDGIVDLLVVVIGAGVAHGLPLDEGWVEILRSNMSKIPLDGVLKKRADGKVLKPDTYFKPELQRILDART